MLGAAVRRQSALHEEARLLEHAGLVERVVQQVRAEQTVHALLHAHAAIALDAPEFRVVPEEVAENRKLIALDLGVAARRRGARFSLACASVDASFRRYFRASLPDGRSYVVMDAPPEQEDCRPFVHVARLLRAAGVHAPEVHAEDLAQGFLLLADLGTQTYLPALNADNAARLLGEATDALLPWTLATRA